MSQRSITMTDGCMRRVDVADEWFELCPARTNQYGPLVIENRDAANPVYVQFADSAPSALTFTSAFRLDAYTVVGGTHALEFWTKRAIWVSTDDDLNAEVTAFIPTPDYADIDHGTETPTP